MSSSCLDSFGLQCFAKCAEELLDARDLRVVAHHADPPHLAGENTESAAHLDSHVEQARANLGLVYAAGNAHDVDHRTAIGSRCEVRDAELVETIRERRT